MTTMQKKPLTRLDYLRPGMMVTQNYRKRGEFPQRALTVLWVDLDKRVAAFQPSDDLSFIVREDELGRVYDIKVPDSWEV
jgi:hypothetical protein